MAATYPGGTNTYVPNTNATNNLVIEFSRNVNSFALPQWAQYVPVKKNVGLYTEMTIEVAGRLINSDLADYSWADGTDANDGHGNTESFEFKPYQSRRYSYNFVLGDLAAEQAAWDVVEQNSRIKAQLAMTARTLKSVTEATTVARYDAANTSAVTSITGVTGKHDVSTTARGDIRRSYHHAINQIQLGTLAAINTDDLMIVMSPDYARAIAESQEIIDYIKGSTDALREVKGELGPNSQFGLPNTLFGLKVVVEKTVRVTSRKGATRVSAYVQDKTRPFVCSRPGGLMGIAGSPSFSTHTVFLKEEMTVEENHDRNNRRIIGRVVDDFDNIVTAPVSGFLFQDAIAA